VGLVIEPTVLAYHAVGDCPRAADPYDLFVTKETFAWQMEYLARKRAVLPLSAVVSGERSDRRPTVAITFDDAYVNVLECAGPILQEYGFSATVFAPTAWLGKPNGWIPPSTCGLEIMSPAELSEAQAAGIEVESHGHAHINMERATRAAVAEDLRRSVERLTDILGRRPRYLAYPFTTASTVAREAVAAAGFEAAFSINRPAEGRFARARVPITPLDGRLAFAFKTSGRYFPIRHSRIPSSGYALLKPLIRSRRRGAAAHDPEA
jgi:peptidoglycan/xylan/chitin deacetylase (PgdA/CDA1 family)